MRCFRNAAAVITERCLHTLHALQQGQARPIPMLTKELREDVELILENHLFLWLYGEPRTAWYQRLWDVLRCPRCAFHAQQRDRAMLWMRFCEEQLKVAESSGRPAAPAAEAAVHA